MIRCQLESCPLVNVLNQLFTQAACSCFALVLAALAKMDPSVERYLIHRTWCAHVPVVLGNAAGQELHSRIIWGARTEHLHYGLSVGFSLIVTAANEGQLTFLELLSSAWCAAHLAQSFEPLRRHACNRYSATADTANAEQSSQQRVGGHHWHSTPYCGSSCAQCTMETCALDQKICILC